MSKKTKSGQTKQIRGTFEKQTQCVLCRSRSIRSIGKGQYFCADCCTEFKVSENKVTVFSISTDGGLMKIS